jgi:hypothetical protein
MLPALPVASRAITAVEVENSLYALGGFAGGDLDTVQKLSLDSLTWKLSQLKLPQAASRLLCFKTDTEVCLVIKETLYLFTPLKIKLIKTFQGHLFFCDSSCYSRGTFYFEKGLGILSFGVGELTSLE